MTKSLARSYCGQSASRFRPCFERSKTDHISERYRDLARLRLAKSMIAGEHEGDLTTCQHGQRRDGICGHSLAVEHGRRRTGDLPTGSAAIAKAADYNNK
jgi:hypothetical protein